MFLVSHILRFSLPPLFPIRACNWIGKSQHPIARRKDKQVSRILIRGKAKPLDTHWEEPRSLCLCLRSSRENTKFPHTLFLGPFAGKEYEADTPLQKKKRKKNYTRYSREKERFRAAAADATGGVVDVAASEMQSCWSIHTLFGCGRISIPRVHSSTVNWLFISSLRQHEYLKSLIKYRCCIQRASFSFSEVILKDFRLRFKCNLRNKCIYAFERYIPRYLAIVYQDSDFW